MEGLFGVAHVFLVATIYRNSHSLTARLLERIENMLFLLRESPSVDDQGVTNVWNDFAIHTLQVRGAFYRFNFMFGRTFTDKQRDSFSGLPDFQHAAQQVLTSCGEFSFFVINGTSKSQISVRVKE